MYVFSNTTSRDFYEKIYFTTYAHFLDNYQLSVKFINVDCETGKYGQDCLQECGHCAGNAVCKVTTGHCRSCTPGLQPPLCKYGKYSLYITVISL